MGSILIVMMDQMKLQVPAVTLEITFNKITSSKEVALADYITQVFIIGCPSGWLTIGNSCYLYDAGPMDADEAYQFCRKKKGKMFEPKNKQINKEVLTHIILKYSGGIHKFEADMWLGIYTDWKEGPG